MHVPSGSPSSSPDTQPEGPATPLLTASFFLAGLGTVLLGPLLPQILREWSLSDGRGGLLLLAKFAGAFLGGVSLPRRVRLGIFAGHIFAAAGFVGFALAHGLALALPALLLAGFGLGEIIAGTNILAGRRYPERTGSALAMINLFWSLGAVSTGLLVAALLPRFSWHRPTLGMAALLLLIGFSGLVFPARQTNRQRAPEQQNGLPGTSAPLPPAEFVRFAGQLFLYGGLETCLTAWLSTFALRFTTGPLLGGQSGFVVLWAALTVGRALAALAMRRYPERAVLRASLAFCLVLIGLLTFVRNALSLSAVCILLGLALAPVFPAIFGLLLRRKPPARTAGTVLAVSGLGAALFPWLMGVLSTQTGSLRIAMVVPALLTPALLVLTVNHKSSPKRPT